MIDIGDVCLADLNEERRRRVLVMSSARFHRLSDRVVVAPEIFGEPDEVPFPWRVSIDDGIFAVDLLRSLPVARILDRIGRASPGGMLEVRRALRNIT